MSGRVNQRDHLELIFERQMYDELYAIAREKQNIIARYHQSEKGRYLEGIGQRIKYALGYGHATANSNDQLRRNIAEKWDLTFKNKSINKSRVLDNVWNVINHFTDEELGNGTWKFFNTWDKSLTDRGAPPTHVEAQSPSAAVEQCDESGGSCVVTGGRRSKTKKAKTSKRSKRTRGRRRG